MPRAPVKKFSIVADRSFKGIDCFDSTNNILVLGPESSEGAAFSSRGREAVDRKLNIREARKGPHVRPTRSPILCRTFGARPFLFRPIHGYAAKTISCRDFSKGFWRLNSKHRDGLVRN